MAQTHSRPDHASPPSTPRWVKMTAIIVATIALLIGILHLTGHSFGGPGSHTMPSGATPRIGQLL